jgi:wobble nucleotide-excising tRNase
MLQVLLKKKNSPKSDDYVWESDETYIQWENEFELKIRREEKEEKEAATEKERKKRLAEDHANQLANMPRMNLFEDAQPEDADEEIEEEDIEEFDYESAHLGLDSSPEN